MHLDLYVAMAGLLVGFTVGLTGMGGGALMTPILVLLFKVQPLAAVSSDLVAAMVMKPVGGSVHARRGTVNWSLVKWLCLGSIPSAFAGVIVVRALGDGKVEDRLKVILGVALVVAALSIVAKSYLSGRMARAHMEMSERGLIPPDRAPFRVKPVPTLVIGALGGLVVGMTSVGSGSLIIVALLVLYPMLTSRELVGTDLVQAVPLVAAAALGHILFGDFKLGLTASVLLGSIPGVYLGARLSSRAPDGVIRPALVFVLLASGLKLVNLSTLFLGIALAAVVVIGLPLWGAVDAAGRSTRHWSLVRRSREQWIRLQGVGAVCGVGFVAALVYFARIRPELVAARDPEVPEMAA